MTGSCRSGFREVRYCARETGINERIPVRRSLTLPLILALLSCDRAAPTLDATPPPPSAATPTATPAPTAAPLRRGVSLGMFVSHPDAEYQGMIYRQMLDEIAALGATDVQIPLRWSQPDVGGVTLSPRRGLTPDDAVLKAVIREAHQRKLQVLLMPVIHLEDRSGGAWRGQIAPRDAEAWWAAYGRFIGHYADLARAEGVRALAVGSELVSMERHGDRWRALIADVRRRFPGQITYSANWDHFEPVPFWDALDVVGVTAYQPLMEQPADLTALPSASALAEGWRPFTQRLRRWAAQTGRRYMITEVGYPAHTYGATRPWDYRPRGQPAPELQARCFEALVQTWRDDPRLDGIYVWNWFGVGGAQDRGYTLRDRRAAQVLSAWFKAP